VWRAIGRKKNGAIVEKFKEDMKKCC